MKAYPWLVLFGLVLSLGSCELFEVKGKKEPVSICGNVYRIVSDDSLNACKPRDTILGKRVFVKYVSLGHDYYLSVGCKGLVVDRGVGYDCRTLKSMVPVYEWSSPNVIALKRGCGGNYCTYTEYYLMPGAQYFERINVMGHDSRRNLITYLIERDSIAIENVYNGRKVAYPILDSIPCPNPLSCINSALFTKNGVEYVFYTLSKGKNKKVSRSYAIPKRLL